MTTRLVGRATIALALAALALAPLPSPAADPLRIDVIAPITGQGAFLGGLDKETMAIGQELINKTGGIQGRPVQFVFSDDESRPQVAVQLLNGILGQKPAVLLGSHLVALCSAMMPLLKNGPATYCLSPAIFPEAGSYVFTGNVSTRDAQRAQIRYFRLRGWRRIALVVSTDATGQDGERGVDEILALPENSEMKLVERAKFGVTDVSISAQVASLKAANPDAVIVWTTGTPLGTVLNGFSQGGLDLPVSISYGNMTYAQFLGPLANILPKQTYIAATPWTVHGKGVGLPRAVEAAQRDFFGIFKAHGLNPDVGAASAWDPMMIFVSALRKLGPNATATQVRDYVMHLKGYAGVNGIYDFEKYPQRGLGEESAVITRWNPAIKTWEIVSKPMGIPL